MTVKRDRIWVVLMPTRRLHGRLLSEDCCQVVHAMQNRLPDLISRGVPNVH